ncbi:uncharacterized protein N7500_010799 [Penicillium coprophilum]|uniref:uncharacterized protein n=1 Tax=Penicillium coprophilum TaxID=36646 RepID=UPI00239E699F|nr:uncharacterized protein N7500_010799 [Penicillium coprophilum]KAJ5150610.1 hypothetical protein N7500_010799 [Penicillium coprophilum]
MTDIQKQDRRDELVARLNALASRKEALRAALEANLTAMKTISHKLSLLWTPTHDNGLSTASQVPELVLIQEELRAQEVQLTADYHHARSQCMEVELLLNQLDRHN